jgi:hypothetical protein
VGAAPAVFGKISRDDPDDQEDQMSEPIPEADRAEQQRPALPEDLDPDLDVLPDEFDPDSADLEPDLGDVAEADPADVADQHRVARLREDDWP